MFKSSKTPEIRKIHVVATMGKRCTKKRDARAKLLFCQSEPIAFWRCFETAEQMFGYGVFGEIMIYFLLAQKIFLNVWSFDD